MANTFGSTATTPQGGNSQISRYNSGSGNIQNFGSSQQDFGGAQKSTASSGPPQGSSLPGTGQYGSFQASQVYHPTNFQQDPGDVTPSGNPYASQPTPGAYSNGTAYGNVATPQYTIQNGLYANAGSAPAQVQGNQFQLPPQQNPGYQQFQSNMNNMRAQQMQAPQALLGNLWQRMANPGRYMPRFSPQSQPMDSNNSQMDQGTIVS